MYVHLHVYMFVHVAHMCSGRNTALNGKVSALHIVFLHPSDSQSGRLFVSEARCLVIVIVSVWASVSLTQSHCASLRLRPSVFTCDLSAGCVPACPCACRIA